VNMDIRADISDAKAGLEALGIELKNLARPLLSALANAARKWTRSRIYSYIHQHTGNLGKDLKTRLYSNYATLASNPARIGETLERGAVIVPRKRRYLTFQLPDGTWRKCRSVKIPAKHHFTRAAAGFEDSSDYNAAIERALARIIRKAGMQ
jgi:hypothetical protein